MRCQTDAYTCTRFNIKFYLTQKVPTCIYMYTMYEHGNTYEQIMKLKHGNLFSILCMIKVEYKLSFQI